MTYRPCYHCNYPLLPGEPECPRCERHQGWLRRNWVGVVLLAVILVMIAYTVLG